MKHNIYYLHQYNQLHDRDSQVHANQLHAKSSAKIMYNK